MGQFQSTLNKYFVEEGSPFSHCRVPWGLRDRKRGPGRPVQHRNCLLYAGNTLEGRRRKGQQRMRWLDDRGDLGKSTAPPRSTACHVPTGPLCPPGTPGARGPPGRAPCSGDTPVSTPHRQMPTVTMSPLWNLVSS